MPPTTRSVRAQQMSAPRGLVLDDDDLLSLVFEALGLDELRNAACVCRHFKEVAGEVEERRHFLAGVRGAQVAVQQRVTRARG